MFEDGVSDDRDVVMDWRRKSSTTYTTCLVCRLGRKATDVYNSSPVVESHPGCHGGAANKFMPPCCLQMGVLERTSGVR